MEVECRASLLALFYVAKLLGKMECNQASKDELEMLRFITPLLKIYTAKQVFCRLFKVFSAKLYFLGYSRHFRRFGSYWWPRLY